MSCQSAYKASEDSVRGLPRGSLFSRARRGAACAGICARGLARVPGVCTGRSVRCEAARCGEPVPGHKFKPTPAASRLIVTWRLLFAFLFLFTLASREAANNNTNDMTRIRSKNAAYVQRMQCAGQQCIKTKYLLLCCTLLENRVIRRNISSVWRSTLRL